MTLKVYLRNVEEALKSNLYYYQINQCMNPIQLWILETKISKEMGFTWQQEDVYGSLIRGFHQQIFVENRGEHIEFIYPKEGDLKLDKDGNPVREHPPVLDADGNQQYDSNGNILRDTTRWAIQQYGEPELFFDEPGRGRITQYIPEALKNCKPAISQFYVELDGWRSNPIGDGSLQKENIIIFQPDLVQYSTNLPAAWATLFRKTNMVANNMLNQNLNIRDFEEEKYNQIIRRAKARRIAWVDA